VRKIPHLFLLLAFSSMWAEMPFPVIESGRVLLTQKNSPYVLETSVVFSAIDTLIVEPGAQVFMLSHAKILLHGPVKILGTPQKRVVFKSIDSTKSWSGIHFVSNSEPFLVRNLTIENAFRNSVTQSSGIFESVQFNNNYYGLWVNSSKHVQLKKCSFKRNRFALSVGAGSVEAEATEISENVFGLYLEKEGEYLGSTHLITKNLEANVRKETEEMAGKGKRVPRSVWHRIESSF